MKHIPMKKHLCFSIFLLLSNICQAQNDNSSSPIRTTNDSTLIEIKSLLNEIGFRMHGINRYKLYPTENIYNFLMLDTKTGKIDIVQWSLDEKTELSVPLNDMDLSYDTGCGTFELYPTKNIYQFLLLDKVTGRKWHVQWGFESNERWIKRIW